MQVSSVNKHQCFCTCKINAFCGIFWFRFFRKSFLTIFNYPAKKVVALNKHFPYPSRPLHKVDFLVWLRNPTVLNAFRGSQSRVCLVWGPYISPVSFHASLSSLFNVKSAFFRFSWRLLSGDISSSPSLLNTDLSTALTLRNISIYDLEWALQALSTLVWWR